MVAGLNKYSKHILCLPPTPGCLYVPATSVGKFLWPVAGSSALLVQLVGSQGCLSTSTIRGGWAAPKQSLAGYVVWQPAAAYYADAASDETEGSVLQALLVCLRSTVTATGVVCGRQPAVSPTHHTQGCCCQLQHTATPQLAVPHRHMMH